MKLRFRANASEPRLFDWYDQEPKVGDFGDVHAITKDGSEMLLEMRDGVCHAKYGCYWTWHDDGLPVEPQEASGSIRQMLSLLSQNEEERTKEGKTKLYFVIEEQPDGVFSDDNRLHGIFFNEEEAKAYLQPGVYIGELEIESLLIDPIYTQISKYAFSRVIEDKEDEEG